jgi:hypothetical protein
MSAAKVRKPPKIEAPPRPTVVPIAAPNRPTREETEDPGLAWTAANIQGRLRGIASALDGLANGASFPDDNDGWLFEVLISALEREADRLDRMETAINNLPKAGAA